MPLLRFGDKRQAFSRLAAGGGFMGDKKAREMKAGCPRFLLDGWRPGSFPFYQVLPPRLIQKIFKKIA